MASIVGGALLTAGGGGVGLLLLYRAVAVFGTWLILRQVSTAQDAELEIEFTHTGLKVRRSINSKEDNKEPDGDQAAT